MLIVDNYFPKWAVNNISEESLLIPVTYSNSPYGEYHVSRFFGQMLMEEEQWIAPCPQHWFVDYLHLAVCNDILLDYKIRKMDRCLLNCQTPGQYAQEHTDWNPQYTGPNRVSGLYYIRGDGNTEFYNENKDTFVVEAVPGRLVLFDSTLWHQGLSPVKEPIRYTLGFVWCCDSLLTDHDPLDLRNPVPIL